MIRIFFKFLRFFKSLQLAVLCIVGLGTISAIGTIVEARYDAEYAQKVIYHSPYMYGILILLCINLIAVMVDRWPWKKRHAAFVLAHMGIIITLLGAEVTKRLGVDGSLALGIGEEGRYVSVRERELGVWASSSGEGLTRLAQRNTDFLMDPPSRENPFVLSLGNKQLEVLEYYHYAWRKTEIQPSEKKADGPAIRFQLQNQNVNFTEWLLKTSFQKQQSLNLGPARVVLAEPGYAYSGGNEIVLRRNAGSKELNYEIYTASKGGKTAVGKIKEGESLETGWMGLKFLLLRYLPQAREKVEFEYRPFPSKITQSAIHVRFDGEEYWMGLNSVLRVFAEDYMYMFTWGNRRIDLGFPLKLENFHMGKYQGTNRASSYESDVLVPGLGKVHISMNEPLHHKGYTFYQASFEQNEEGQVAASILSVNYDPGRPLKYIGCLLIVLGTIFLFYFKKWGRKVAPKG